jgi:zeaxanthin glucosyltransferase
MRCLFMVFPEPGHLHPFIGVAQRLSDAGHEVAFASIEDLAGRLQSAGLSVPCFSAIAAGGRRALRPRRGSTFTEALGDPARARLWYEYALLGTVAAQIDVLRNAVGSFRPQVVCTDPVAYAGAVVAEEAHLPWAAVAPNLVPLAPPGWTCPYLDALDALAPERERLFRSRGLSVAFRHGEAVSPWLNTVFATEDFVPRAQIDNDEVLYAGPSSASGRRGDESEFPWAKLREDLPLVYVSFGSQLSPPPHVVESIARAMEEGEAQWVIALASLSEEPFVGALPPHAIVVRYAPQLKLLERCVAAVIHGGANSVAECLAQGKPMLVVPLGHEQPLQALLVERAGVGAALAPEEVSPASVRSRLRPLLAAGTACDRARAISVSYRAQDGAGRVAELLVALATTRQPLRRGRTGG